ncbi:MAG: glycoside hydrolase family 16 protein [Bacteroidetes bacterium]|nr:glycoside hydrolase family 16 protein [Bacteroidota bacterium]
MSIKRIFILIFVLVVSASVALSLTYRTYKKHRIPPQSKDRPLRTLHRYLDNKYLLYQLPNDYYKGDTLAQSFEKGNADFITSFEPLGYSSSLHLQYTHVYSPECVYHTSDKSWKYAEVCFPNTCLTKDSAYASVTIRNTASSSRIFYVRLFYQNTSYWYPTNDSINMEQEDYLDNYYGASRVVSVSIAAFDSTIVKIPYHIGMNPKREFNNEPHKDPARPGNYEFMVLALTNRDELLMNDALDLKEVNPFAVVQKDRLQNEGNKYFNQMAYTPPQHFKFVFLDEYFDGINDLAPNHIYIPKDRDEKKLCDTCSGWFRNTISEKWKVGDFFRHFGENSRYVKADYGVRKENFHIDSNGVVLDIPKSTTTNYQKTWGEFLFGPSFKYGHLTVRARFAQMINSTGTPNGIIHNLWLYERDHEIPDTVNNPYRYFNGAGNQPFEIDFEFWTSQDNVNTMWDDNGFINYSIVDYMRNPNVAMKPGEMKDMGKYKVNRLNNHQLNIPGGNINRLFFNRFHTYELYWYPDHVRFLVDGYEQAVITKEMAKIPDKYMFLWISSPFYQDGTYFSQSEIPFLVKDKKTEIDYIKIE